MLYNYKVVLIDENRYIVYWRELTRLPKILKSWLSFVPVF